MSGFNVSHARRAKERIRALMAGNLREVVIRILDLEENPTPDDCVENDAIQNGYTIVAQGYVILYLVVERDVKIVDIYPEVRQ